MHASEKLDGLAHPVVRLYLAFPPWDGDLLVQIYHRACATSQTTVNNSPVSFSMLCMQVRQKAFRCIVVLVTLYSVTTGLAMWRVREKESYQGKPVWLCELCTISGQATESSTEILKNGCPRGEDFGSFPLFFCLRKWQILPLLL